MYTWCEADWYNGPSCGSSALCQINITYPCHYNLVSPSLSFIPHIINLSLHPETWSVLSLSHHWVLFFFTPCSYYPLLHGCPQEEPEGGCLTNGPWAPSREGRRCQSYESWDTTPPLPLPRPLLSLSLASTPCSGAGRSCVPPNQCLHASPKTITLSSTNQRKWGDKSTPGVCACVVFHPTWHPQGHSEGFKVQAGGYNMPVTILSHGRHDFDGTHFIMAQESECAPLTLD